MYERMLNKKLKPTNAQIDDTLGQEAVGRLGSLETFLTEHYVMGREIVFPFGNRYGWGYKYSHKTKTLCHVFFEQGAFTVTLQIGDACVDALEKKLPVLLQKTRELWQKRYPCGERGGWLHYRVLSDEELQDVFALIKAKVKPAGKGTG